MDHPTLKDTFSSRRENGIRGSEYGGYVDYEFDETKEIDSTSQPSSPTELGSASRDESTISRKEPSTISAPVSKPGSKEDASARSNRTRWNVAPRTQGATDKRYYFVDTGFDCTEHSEIQRELKADSDKSEFSFRFRYALLLTSCVLISAAVAVLLVRRTAASYYEAIADAPADVLAPITAPRQEHPLHGQVAPTKMQGVPVSFTTDDTGLSASPGDEPSVAHRSLPTSTTSRIKAGEQRNLSSHGEDVPLMDLVEPEKSAPKNVSSSKRAALKKSK